jgi:hypothetical protein
MKNTKRWCIPKEKGMKYQLQLKGSKALEEKRREDK